MASDSGRPRRCRARARNSRGAKVNGGGVRRGRKGSRGADARMAGAEARRIGGGGTLRLEGEVSATGRVERVQLIVHGRCSEQFHCRNSATSRGDQGHRTARALHVVVGLRDWQGWGRRRVSARHALWTLRTRLTTAACRIICLFGCSCLSGVGPQDGLHLRRRNLGADCKAKPCACVAASRCYVHCRAFPSLGRLHSSSLGAFHQGFT
eukprot:3486899-Pleurochrysis_carterae.AAC.4